MLTRLLIVAVVAGLALGACGRRGSLEPPPGVQNAQPVPKPGQFPDRQPEGKEEPFVLDGLL